MKRVLALGFVCALLLQCALSITTSSYLTNADKERLKAIFSQPPSDLSLAHYNALGLSLLGVPVPEAACSFLNQKLDSASLESLYHASSTAKHLKSCKVAAPQATLDKGFKDGASITDLFYATMTQKNLGLPLDSAKISKLLQAALKKDDSILNLGYSFHIAALLSGDLKSYFERIEDAIVQADEVDGKYLQFEGGISITANVLIGAYNLAEAAKKGAPAISPDQALKFTNYFLNRKHVQSPKGAALLLQILKVLTQNQYHVPLAITLASPNALSAKSPLVEVRVTNVLGVPVGPLKVELDSAVRLDDKKTLLSKKPLVASAKDSSLYSLNLLESKPLRGSYKLSLSATPAKPDPRFIGNTGAELNLKVLTTLSLPHIDIGVEDRDQTAPTKTVKVLFGNKMASSIEADYHQRLQMKFSLHDQDSKSLMLAHQVFVALTHESSKQEILFLAEPDSSLMYKFELDVHQKAKEFDHQSGSYSLSVIVGDAVVSNPFVWDLGSILLTFPSQGDAPAPSTGYYQPKPEIKHLFRPQEKRPAAIVSTTFSGLVLVPWMALLLLWAKVGINISNFPVSLPAVGFHAGLGGIFSLFAYFWYGLDMFTTLKYLSALGLLTFLSGHSMLSKLANKK